MTTRTKIRAAHLVASAATAAVVYAPGVDPATAVSVARWVSLPALAATGLTMWKLPAIRRRLRRT